MKLNVTEILEKVLTIKASDLHIVVGAPPFVRINTKLSPLTDYGPLTLEDVDYFISQIVDEQQKEILDVNKELDFSIALGNKARFRVNTFFQKGYPSAALRSIPLLIPSFKELNLPDILGNICELRQGLVLVVGPTGHGKSTTLASMIDRINQTRSEHIITIEDPIEYIFTNKLSLIEQREMHLDTFSWDIALKSLLRQDPNVILIGEMRDAETISTALQIAETGHLVLATLHTNSASQTVDRIIASFPESKRTEVRMQLASVLEVVISQRLLFSEKSNILPALELMFATEAIRNIIREGKTHMIDNIILTGGQFGMVTLEKSLAELIKNDLVDAEYAIRFSNKPEDVKRMIKVK